MSKSKAIVLLSGGLDSMLAVKLLQIQDIEVQPICFKSNFYGCEKAENAARELDLDLKIIDISSDMLSLVKNPPNGYGKNLNPCVDCHAMMIKKAGELAEQEGYDFVATGEVLGQRPFSQNRESLERVRKLSGVDVLRPLSAKLLTETDAEKKDLVRRGRLQKISGRSRDAQFELAKKYGLKEYSSPAGGCILTDPDFSERLGKMLDYWTGCKHPDVELLKNGRVFWFKNKKNKNILAIIGRHQEDNERLEKLAQKGDIMVKLKEINGPNTLIRGLDVEGDITLNKLEIPEKIKMGEFKIIEEKTSEEIINIVSILTGYYTTKARGKIVIFKYKLFN